MSAALVLSLVVVVFAAMWWGWRARARRQGGLALHPATPSGRVRETADVLYVATTQRGRPLERVVAHGLGFRARGALDVAHTSAVLRLPEREDLVLPAGALTRVAPATWTIDRVVERDGLLVLEWSAADGHELDTYLRVIDPTRREAIERSLDRLVAATDPYIAETEHDHG